MKAIRIIIYFLCLYFCFSCSSLKNPEKIKKYVLFNTSSGSFIIGLYKGTPLHRKNFINNCKNGIYDTCLLYYVKPMEIRKVGIKEGEKEEEILENNYKNSNTIPAELNPKLINKKGAVAMLNVPNSKNSDSRLFYIVEGLIIKEQLMEAYVNKTNLPVVKKYIDKFLEEPERKYLKDSLYNLQIRRLQDDDFGLLWAALRDSVIPLIEKDGIEFFSISQLQSNVYREIGGFPILDNKNTVFGEIVWNMEIFNSLKTIRSDNNYLITEKLYFYNNKIMNKCQYKKYLKQQKK